MHVWLVCDERSPLFSPFSATSLRLVCEGRKGGGRGGGEGGGGGERKDLPRNVECVRWRPEQSRDDEMDVFNDGDDGSGRGYHFILRRREGPERGKKSLLSKAKWAG